MSWPDRTLADEPDLVRQYRIGASTQITNTTTIQAPCCNRRSIAADMVAWVPGEGWLCDGCRSALRRDDSTPWTKPKLIRAMGAPPVAVRREYVRRLVRARYIDAKRRNETVRRRDVFQSVNNEVPKDEYPPETQPPTS